MDAAPSVTVGWKVVMSSMSTEVGGASVVVVVEVVVLVVVVVVLVVVVLMVSFDNCWNRCWAMTCWMES